jgi:hypothetical protein
VPIFESGIQQVNSSVGTIASLVWQPSNTSATTFGPLGSVASAAALKDVMVQNTGTNVIYVGMGSAAAAATTGAQVQPGGYALFSGYSVTAGTAVTGNIWAQTGTVGQTSSTVAGMASVISVV